jgi:hypothetical protein
LFVFVFGFVAVEFKEGGREKNGVALSGIGGVSIVAATPLELEMEPDVYLDVRKEGFG